jgi:3-isopropylmalate/(R)-2-methylmalate dehydratase large subunit
MAGMTITEKVLAKAAVRERVEPGELIWANIYSVMTMDYIGKSTFDLFDSIGVSEVFDKDRIVCVSDHLAPPSTPQHATLLNQWREAVWSHGITNFYDLGRQGIAHQLMVEQGYVLPGTVCVGTDSHANMYGAVGAVGNAVSVTDAAVAMATGKCWFRVPESVKFNVLGKWQPWVSAKDLSLHVLGMMHWNGHLIYKAVEFGGPAIESLDMAGRMTLVNMTVDLGCKNGIIAADEVTQKYLKNRSRGSWEIVRSDVDAIYDQEYEIDVSKLEPMVAVPHRLDDVKPVGDVAGRPVNKAFLGTCTNGRLEDLAVLAGILKGKRVHSRVNLLVVPASQEIYLEAIKAGYIQEIVEAGGAVDTPSCSACAGIHTGVTGDGDVVISSGNRNMQGRMGSNKAEIYLASPAVVAASALNGVITDPRELRI